LQAAKERKGWREGGRREDGERTVVLLDDLGVHVGNPEEDREGADDGSGTDDGSGESRLRKLAETERRRSLCGIENKVSSRRKRRRRQDVLKMIAIVMTAAVKKNTKGPKARAAKIWTLRFLRTRTVYLTRR
jgi:hypothetical protein